MFALVRKVAKHAILTIVAFSLFVGLAPVADASVYVQGYYRSNGTYVAPYVRSNPSTVKTSVTNPPSKQYYKNVDGVSVKTPVKSPYMIPSGATAKCKDGTYSFSLHRSGTCSGHRGVSSWLK